MPQQREVTVSLPLAELPLPAIDKDSGIVLPTPELAKVEAQRLEISGFFTAAEKSHVATSDPRLFKDGNSLIIDLALLQQDEHAFPLPGAKLISPYAGKRKNYTGVDLKTFANDTIVSAFDGVVRLAKSYAAYGNVIVVRHYNGLETLYSHNSKHLVKPGDPVKAGQPIALVGRTGRATTDHLHFEARVNGRPFDPSLVFNFETHDLHTKYLVCTQKGNGITVQPVDMFRHMTAEAYTYETPADKPLVSTFID
ncbi:MAG: M23 family metallopeptidase [Tannerellaceae bacterium]|nr:M23 family metallopeptidase [Tannerellaceae bacterium]